MRRKKLLLRAEHRSHQLASRVVPALVLMFAAAATLITDSTTEAVAVAEAASSMWDTSQQYGQSYHGGGRCLFMNQWMDCKRVAAIANDCLSDKDRLHLEMIGHQAADQLAKVVPPSLQGAGSGDNLFQQLSHAAGTYGAGQFGGLGGDTMCDCPWTGNLAIWLGIVVFVSAVVLVIGIVLGGIIDRMR